MAPEPGPQPQDEGGEPTSPRDRWWFSPMLRVVAGGAVAAFQWGPIRDGTANWLNWTVAALGLVVLVVGAIGWVSAWRRP